MGNKILTVDDSRTIRMIVKKAFRPYDCEMIEGENGIEGLAAASKEKPDLIVLDIIMPVMDGYAVLDKLRGTKWGKDTPVILLTNLSDGQRKSVIEDPAVRGYLVKSNLSLAEVVSRIEEILK